MGRSGQIDIRVVKSECVSELSVDTMETSLSEMGLVRDIRVQNVDQVEAAKVPDHVEQVVECIADGVACSHDYSSDYRSRLECLSLVCGKCFGTYLIRNQVQNLMLR